jgi:hypothetical protein
MKFYTKFRSTDLQHYADDLAEHRRREMHGHRRAGLLCWPVV